MKIAFVMTQSLDSPSGLGRYWPLAKELVKKGDEVEIFALHYSWSTLNKRSFVDSGVAVKYVSQMHVMKEGPKKTYFSPTRFIFISLLATLRLARAVAGSKAQIIQICKPQPYNVIAARIGRRGRFLYCDCDDFEAETNYFRHEWQRRVVRYFEDGIIRWSSGLTANTRFTQERYEELGFPKDKILFIPNGVDRQRFSESTDGTAVRKKWSIPASSPVVSYIGTLGLQSHPVDLLLEAVQLLINRWPSLRLLIVGGGEDYDQLQAMARHLGIDGATIFTGRVPPSEIPDYLAASALTVDPVKDDLVARARSPLKLLESLAVGIPVVTSDVGDRALLTSNGQLGRMVIPGNSKALADGIAELLDNQSLSGQISKQAKSFIEEFYWDKLVNKFSRIYE
ncbi:MAG: glycosyltransferase [Anaerolineae bacterium]|nr:MAG: glycosyltransferase [Anaerolineae bacterium]